MIRIFTLYCIALILTASGQTLTINNDSQTFATLASTVVTMTGRSELRITGASAPLTGSTIHLNSSDSWLFMTNIRPSVVSSTYLSQIRVNGAAAVLNTNCRMVQYADGTVIIPHLPSYSPLQVFSGSHFTGTSLSLQNYTTYNDASLGVLANNISSFKLKRGYTATLAQNANGTGVSTNYVSQDGDIEVSVLPVSLDDSVSFIRVFPWRWVTKKGSCDVDPTALNSTWFYNWNIDQNSTLNWEYVAIKQQPNWPSLTQNWQTRGVNHLLGFNEPNNSVEDAYLNLTPVGSVSNAVARMPELLGTGLRVGAPAVTDGGTSWITDFVNQSDAAGHRLDFIPIHYYRSIANNNNPAGAASSMYSFLKSIHDATGRPIWVTEFNNGANWTTDADPTVDQNKNVIEAMINMMDATPWIERYAVYSKVEWFRQTHYDDGSITPMGVMYRDHLAPIAYQQVIPEVQTAPAALYRFENDARDSSAYGHAAILKGGAKFTTGHPGQAVVMSGVAADGDCVQLSSRLGDSTDFTFGAWVYPTSASQWQRIFDLGSSTTSYMFLTPAAGTTGNLRFAIADGGAEQQLNHNAPLTLNTWTHVAVTISGNTGKLFVNGALVATNNSMTLNPIDLDTSNNYLGKSQFPDPLFAGRLDEVEFLPYALTDANVAALVTNTPPQFTSATLVGSPATQNVAYSSTLAAAATDADAGDAITFSKAAGPSWLVVAANGALSGTPTFDDEGNHEFIVYATDRAGASSYTLLTIQLPMVSGNGTWTTNANGNWSDLTKWTSNFPANGMSNTANFSTLNIAADRTVTLDASRTIGNLQFGDSGGAQSWTVAPASGRVLTLDVASGIPSIVVNQNTATISAPLAGSEGFTKSGPGTLILKGNNSLTGTLYLDQSSATNDGAVRLASPNSAAGLSGIQIRNNNAGYSTLELDGTLGDVTIPATAPVALSGRASTSVAAIRNLVGNNTFSGALTISNGGSSYYFQSDAGTLNLDGPLTAGTLATGSRTLTFLGAGNFTINGVISNGSATTGISLIMDGGGTLKLVASHTFTGDLTIQTGTVTAGTAQGSTPVASNLGALQPASNRNVTINNGGTLALTGGNVLGTGGSTNTLANTTLVINSGGLFKTGLDGSAVGWWNKLGATNLNGGTIRVGSGANTTNFQGLALLSTVTVGGSTPSLIESFAASSSTTNGIHLGQNGTAGQVITFNVADATASSATDLTISARLLNTSANLIASGLIKTGLGTMNLSGANTYTGSTTVSGGTLFVNGSTAASAITVATGASLGGNGTLGGPTTVQSGGNLTPGAGGIGTLTSTGAVILQAGSTTRMEINKTAATRDVLSVAAIITYGGTLLVSNLSGTLTAGDAFTLFQGASITGTFSTITLPPLNFGFMWDTSTLPSGIIRVLPVITTYPGWASGYAFPLGSEAATSDADDDGMANAIEWLFGSNPLLSDPSFLPQSTVRTLTTAEYPAAVAGKHYLTMTARVRKIHTGMTLIPQANNTLNSIDAAASAGLVSSFLISDLGDFEQRTWVYTQAIEDSPNGLGFMRLKLAGD